MFSWVRRTSFLLADRERHTYLTLRTTIMQKARLVIMNLTQKLDAGVRHLLVIHSCVTFEYYFYYSLERFSPVSR